MAVNVATGSFNITLGAATATVAVTDPGFLPVAGIFWWSGRSEDTDTSGSADSHIGIGFVGDGLDQICLGHFSDDAADDTACGYRHDDDGAILETNAAGAEVGHASLTSWDATGFTFTINAQFTTNFRVSYMVFGGDCNEAAASYFEPSATGSLSVESITSEAPQIVFFIAVKDGVNADYGTTGIDFGFGAATGAAEEATVVYGVRTALTDSDTGGYGYGAECASRPFTTTGSMLQRIEFTSMDATGFTVNTLENNNNQVFYLALCGNFSALVGDDVTRTDTSNFDITTTGLDPAGVMICSACRAESTQDTMTANAMFSLGAGTGADSRTAQASSDQDAQAASEVFTAIEHDSIYIRPDLADGVAGLMDLVSMGSEKFTAKMDDADPDAAFFWYAAIGDATAGAAGDLGSTLAAGVGSAVATITASSTPVPVIAHHYRMLQGVG